MVDGGDQARAFARDSNETAIEQAIQAKGLNAPRLTPDDIDAAIVRDDFHVFPGTTLTVCALTLRNGFVVTGESAAASPANFDPAIGRDIARRNAREKIWAFEGYLLRERLAAVAAAEVGQDRAVEAPPFTQDTRSRGEPRVPRRDEPSFAA